MITDVAAELGRIEDYLGAAVSMKKTLSLFNDFAASLARTSSFAEKLNKVKGQNDDCIASLSSLWKHYSKIAANEDYHSMMVVSLLAEFAEGQREGLIYF